MKTILMYGTGTARRQKRYEVLVDDEDYERVIKHVWRVRKETDNLFYATIRTPSCHYQSLHRFILNAKKGDIIDHADGNGLNNQKSNLRLCEVLHNQWNTRPPVKRVKENKNLPMGVENFKTRFRAAIKLDRKRYYLGLYGTPEEAGMIYQKAKALRDVGNLAGFMEFVGSFYNK